MLKIIRYIAIAEGISYLSFALTMPLKYAMQITSPNYFVGQIHGLLFITFVILTLMCANEFKWKRKQILVLLVSSIIPGGTFWSEKRYLRTNS